MTSKGIKTEHSGAKKGRGAFYGKKKDAKKTSNKLRRKKLRSDDIRTPEGWEPSEYW